MPSTAEATAREVKEAADAVVAARSKFIDFRRLFMLGHPDVAAALAELNAAQDRLDKLMFHFKSFSPTGWETKRGER